MVFIDASPIMEGCHIGTVSTGFFGPGIGYEQGIFKKEAQPFFWCENFRGRWVSGMETNPGALYHGGSGDGKCLMSFDETKII